jgi:Leucine-rich repeat (LRR) protein
LDLAYLPIRELPDLSKMKKLEWLHLEHCSQLNGPKLLAELANARELQYLNLNEVPLKTLPKTIFNWQKIQTLRMRYCGLSFFPTNGNFPKLKILDLSGNAFDEPSKARLQQKFGTGMLEEFKL